MAVNQPNATPSATTAAQIPVNTVTQIVTNQQTVQSAYRYLAAWTVILVVLFLMAKTKIGYTAIYYVLVLAIVFLLITQYQAIQTVIAPASGTVNQAPSPAHGGGGSAGGF
jgi:hypothetical protein